MTLNFSRKKFFQTFLNESLFGSQNEIFSDKFLFLSFLDEYQVFIAHIIAQNISCYTNQYCAENDLNMFFVKL